MDKLILSLIKEHVSLFETLTQVKNMGITSKEGKAKLISAKDLFVNHLKKEDGKLYPVLNEIAVHDENLKKTLDIFAKNMSEISKFAMDFFNTHAESNSDIEFARDFGKFYALLKERMRKEETVIYPEYDEHAPKK